ncbi:short-chain dehydrogenase [Mycobacterium lentiflavum]|uniref:3-oxoacyl-[acyl-carrier-protein] reductase MabA n=1 Tax=Mycobacterium lentiflavum TaxID=141349 RepID=A0A0E3WBS6_MYCLN|nr:SDR family oxidoreductase [Mycobacterium lentiflavum]CQD09262.1 short-chain dehydrogenase [Mycobacterium lentiflavum]
MNSGSARPLEGRVALVTGASRGIGAAIAKRFACEGAVVALGARSLDHPAQGVVPGTLRETVADIEAAGGHAVPYRLDLTSPESRAAVLDCVVADLGPVDILVNNAATAVFMPFTEITEKRLRLVTTVNYLAPFDLCQRVIPTMRARGGGWVLNISSYAGDIPTTPPPDPTYHFQTAYGSAKSALNRLTEALASEFYADSIVANTLAPVKAVLTEGVKVTLTEETLSDTSILEPVEAMAEAALALCTSDRDGLNGGMYKSLTLLEQLGRTIRTLDGKTLLEVS